MEDKIELLSEFLTQQLNHWVLFPLALTIMGLTSRYTAVPRPDLLMWAICGFFPVVFYFLRRKISRFPLFVLSHIGAAVLFTAVPAEGPVNRALCVICGIYYMIHSFSLRVKDIPSTPLMHPFISMGLSLLSILLLYQQKVFGWEGFYMLALTGSFGLYLIIYYLQHYLSFLSLNAGSAEYVPAKEMFSSGMGLVLGCTLFCTLILVLCTNMSRLEAIAGLLKKIMTAALGFFFSLFLKTSPETEMLPVQPQESPPFSENFPLDAMPEEPFWLWEILEKAAAAAMVCLFLYCTLRLIFRIIRFIRKHFYWNIRRQTIDMGTGVFEVREKCDNTDAERHVPEKRETGFLTPSAQIRRLYRKKVLQSGSAFRFFTPREYGRILKAEDMACIYEQARYSQKKMTRTDVKKMREAVKSPGH